MPNSMIQELEWSENELNTWSMWCQDGMVLINEDVYERFNMG